MHVKTPGSLPVGGFISFYYNEDDRVNRMIEIDRNNPRTLQFSINADSFFIFPFIPIHIRWSVSDDKGNFEISPEESIVGQDPRYEWQKLDSTPLSLTIYWHDRSADFGERIFTAAEEAVEKMELEFGARPEEPITVLIYNSSAELIGYLDSFSETVGGQAFSDLGLTIQVVEDDFFMDTWISDVIPHEISHLYFYQATGGEKVNMSYWPAAWLNEGLAQINTYGIDQKKLDDIHWELKNSQWLPTLQYLSVNFGMNDEYTDIDYKIAYSVTCFLITEFGKDQVAAILKEYRNGSRTEDRV